MSKNIYILPTDKFQNIKLSLFENKLYLGDIASTALPQHIYITSDEEIKEGDWVICLENIFKNEIFKVDSDVPNKSCNVTLEFAKKYLTKIILTTDQDLIKDGVQSIPDEFLEWFVENPSCERVEIIKDEIKVKSNGIQELMKDEYYRQFPEELPNCVFIDKYKIIIPKEEYYFPDIKIGSILSSEDIVKDITELENQSFEGWTTDSIKGYLLACKNIKEKLI